MAGADDGSVSWLTAGNRTNSFSGNAFSVMIGLGKLLLPLGHRVSVQKPRMCVTNPAIWLGVSESSNPGISDDRPTPGPPFAMARCQSASGSAVVQRQSLRSIGTTVMVGSFTWPLPSSA